MLGQIDTEAGSGPAMRPRSPARASRLRTPVSEGGLRRLAREPLVHFLAAAALLLAATTLAGRFGVGGGQTRILLSSSRIEQLRETWAAQWGRAPSAAELQGLIDDAVREEVFYREALASGLDKEDTILRRHLAQKVEFLAQSLTSATDPLEADLARFFEQHHDRYRLPPRASFSHIYFSLSKRGAGAEIAARALLRELRSSGSRAGDVQALGDSFMLQREYPPQTPNEVRDAFGSEFAKRLFDLAPGEWDGPLVSSLGVHLVRVAQVIPSRLPALDEVRDQVVLDYKDQQLRSAVDAYYRKVRERYRVVVEPPRAGAPAP